MGLLIKSHTKGHLTACNYVRSFVVTCETLSPHLIDAVSHRLQRELSRSIHRLAVISWPPAGAVDVNDLRHVADGGRLNDVSHKGLVQHPYA